jgi:hypothetical protein
VFVITTPFSIHLESLASIIRQEKEIKDLITGNIETELSLFLDDITTSIKPSKGIHKL